MTRSLVHAGEELHACRVEAFGNAAGGALDAIDEVVGGPVQIAENFRPHVGDLVEIFSRNRLETLGYQHAALVDLLAGRDAGAFDRRRDVVGRGLQMIGEIAAGGLDDLGEIGGRLPDLVGGRDGGALDGAADVLVDAAQLFDALAESLDDIRLHAFDASAEARRFFVEQARGLAERIDLTLEMAREILQFADQHAGHPLHLRRLAADFAAGRVGAAGHVVDGAGEVGRGFLETRLELLERCLGVADDAVEILGVRLQAGEQRIGVVVDDETGLMQGRALVLEPAYQAADAVLVAAEGALDRGDFLMHDFLEHRGALHGMFDAADQKIDFGAHRLGNGGEAFGGDVLGADKTHGRLHEHFRDLAQLRRPPQEIGGDPDDDDRQHQKRHGPHGFRQGGAGKRRGAAEQGAGKHGEPGGNPDQRHAKGHPIGRIRRPAAELRQHHGRAGIVFIGRAGAQRGGLGWAGGVAPGLDVQRAGGGALVAALRFSRVYHGLYPRTPITVEMAANTILVAFL